jgi:hypothetical protein
VSSTSTPPADARPGTPKPTSVRVAVIVMSVIAGVLLLYSVATWLGRRNVIDQLVAADIIAREDGMRFIVTQLIPFVALGLMLAASAWFLSRRRAWARWLGLASTVLLGLLTLLSIVAGVLSILTLLLLILSIAAITSLAARTTRAWVPRLRGTR